MSPTICKRICLGIVVVALLNSVAFAIATVALAEPGPFNMGGRNHKDLYVSGRTILYRNISFFSLGAAGFAASIGITYKRMEEPAIPDSVLLVAYTRTESTKDGPNPPSVAQETARKWVLPDSQEAKAFYEEHTYTDRPDDGHKRSGWVVVEDRNW